MGRLIDIDILFDYFGNDAIDETTRSNIEYFVREKGTVEAIPKAKIKKFLEEGIKDVSNNVIAIVREEYIHKSDYETRLNADMVAMLEDLKQDLLAEAYGIEMDCTDYVVNVADIDKAIQQEINKLKGEEE